MTCYITITSLQPSTRFKIDMYQNRSTQTDGQIDRYQCLTLDVPITRAIRVVRNTRVLVRVVDVARVF